MKITRVETIVITAPMLITSRVLPKQGAVPRTSMDTLLVRVDTDAGVTGWGEGFGHRIFAATRVVIDQILAPLCIGRDPAQIEGLIDEFERNLHGAGRNGPALYALSAIDIALWDIAAKVAGLPLYRLLGGAPCMDLPGYASLLRYGEPAAVSARVEEVLRRGYRRVKLHEITEPNIRAGREAAGPTIPLMVDCNCPWSIDEAIAMAERLQPLDLTWLEEPIFPPENAAGLARVRLEGGIPTAAGENAMLSDFEAMFAHGALAYCQPSVTKVGGLTRLRQVVAAARRHGVKVAPHSAYFGPGFLATIHAIAAFAPEASVEYYDCDFALNPLHDALTPDQNGRFAVPQAPGLGRDPDLAVIAKLRVS